MPKWIPFVLTLLALGVLVLVLPIGEYLARFFDWVQAQGAWAPVILAFAYIPLTIILIPGSIPTLFAGFAFGLWKGVATVSFGYVLGAAATFLLGRTFMRDFVVRRVAKRPKLRAVDEAVGENGFKIVLLLRLSPLLPYNVSGYVFGITRVGFWQHVFGTWFGMVPGTVMFVYFGTAARDLSQIASGEMKPHGATYWIVFGFGLACTVVVTILLARLATRAIAKSTAEAQQA